MFDLVPLKRLLAPVLLISERHKNAQISGQRTVALESRALPPRQSRRLLSAELGEELLVAELPRLLGLLAAELAAATEQVDPPPGGPAALLLELAQEELLLLLQAGPVSGPAEAAAVVPPESAGESAQAVPRAVPPRGPRGAAGERPGEGRLDDRPLLRLLLRLDRRHELVEVDRRPGLAVEAELSLLLLGLLLRGLLGGRLLARRGRRELVAPVD